MSNPMIDDYPVQIPMPVAWGQMDAFGHVNNIQFFRFFEDARLAYFEKTGIGKDMEKTGQGPILAKTSCVFKKPLTYPDQLTCCTRVTDIGEDRFTMEYAIFSEKNGLAALGEGRIVMLDYKTGAKIPIPPTNLAAMKALAG